MISRPPAKILPTMFPSPTATRIDSVECNFYFSISFKTYKANIENLIRYMMTHLLLGLLALVTELWGLVKRAKRAVL